jgi:hypothetical protein
MVTSLSAQTVQQGIAKVVSIKGSARYMSGSGGAWQPLRNGAVLKPGSIVQTASGSYVDIILNNAKAAGASFSTMSAASAAPPTSGVAYQPKAEQDAVRIFENSVLGIDKLTVDQTGVDTVTETQFDLKAGSIFGSVKKLSAASKYEVKIPNGVAGIRGTTYYINAAGVLRVMSGSVVLAWVGQDGAVVTKIINAGEQFDLRSGQLSPIMSSDLQQMKTVADFFHFELGANPPGTSFYKGGEPIYFLSPTTG